VTRVRNLALLFCAAFALAGGVARTPRIQLATGRIATAPWPYLPGSRIPLRVDGFSVPYRALVLGPGEFLSGGIYEIPADASPGTAMLVAGNAAGLASTTLHIAASPSIERNLLIVASYDDGLVFHDGATFAVLGVLSTGGAPSDAAVDGRGRVAVTDTQGSALTIASLAPWSVRRVEGVLLGDEVVMDQTTQSAFVTDRDADGTGALTRVGRDGGVVRVVTGTTAEGLALDERRQIVYVANTNDGTVAAIDARSMRVLRRFRAVSRVFSLALSPDGNRLYAISNQSAGSLFGASGFALAIDLRGTAPRVVARSADLTFPLGAVLDANTATLFVTDEGSNEVDVLDAATLRPKRAPLRTCSTPWKPAIDRDAHRLYVPCAQSDAVDVFDTRTLRRIRGAPFRTGSYPLAVAIWRPSERIPPGKIGTPREVLRAAK
jgi:DNA-binding beta-propeller fold protein YncE